MRLAIILILAIAVNASGQDITGKYRNYFGRKLELRKDSTFRFDWRFDLAHEWAAGKWSSSGRLINLNFITVYDTLSRLGKPDSLVLSLDEVSSKINEYEFFITFIIASGQRKERFPDDFLRRGKRLYLVDQKGKIIRGRRTGTLPRKNWLLIGYKKWPRWYYKTDDNYPF